VYLRTGGKLGQETDVTQILAIYNFKSKCK